MHELLPHILAQARRGPCPTCGAPLQLAESGREARCNFCGGASTLSYTLRAIEPEAAKLEKARIKGATRWMKKQAAYEPCTCPGCGAEFNADTSQSIQSCKYCGAESKLETRLLPITTDDVAEPQERTRADAENQRRGRIDYPWSISGEQLVWRLLHEPDAGTRVNVASYYNKWIYIDHTAAHFLPWTLRVIQRDVDAVAFMAADVIGKLLCEGDPTLWPGVIQAVRGVVFDANVKPCIVQELALGEGVCVKTLIDAAEYAAGNGVLGQAWPALWGVQTLIGRNFDEHPVIAQIVLYRLFYLNGPVLGWALDALRNSYLRGRYPIEFLLRAIDEIGAERPQIVPHLLECLYIGPAENADEFRKRLSWIREAISWGGKAAAFELLYTPPVDDRALYEEAIDLVDEYLDDPQAGESVETALMRLITNEREHTNPAIDALIVKRGESLNDRVKREYIRRNPQTALLDTSKPYYWQSEPKRALSPELEALVAQWKQGIRDGVDDYRTRMDAARKFRDSVQGEVELFLRDGPATIPLTETAAAEVEKDRKQKQRNAERKQRQPEVDRIQAEMNRVQSEYSQKLMDMSGKMQDSMHDQKAMQDYSAQMMKLAEEMQTRIGALQKELQRLLSHEAE
ncbi:MAG: OmpH family outer membrane protein [Planctomycetes bacterium]|nr:OmpH family outer membrane protein [Planctomycetota bacterium]